MFIFISSNVSAEELSIDPDLVEEGDFINNPEDDSNLVEGIDYDIENKTIYFDDVEDSQVVPNEDNAITPFMILMPGPLHKTTDVKYVGETIGTSTLWKTSGKPGMNIGLNFTKGTNATVSVTYGASYSNLSANLNFTIGKSYSVSSTGTYKVPKTYNGKAVSRAEVTGHPIYKKYSMKVHKRNDIYFRYDYKGVAYAYKPIGIDMKYKHYYK